MKISLATLEKSSTSLCDELVLTEGQKAAKEKILKFLSARDESVMVLKGYAGTGKTTLIQTIIKHIPKADKLAKIVNPKHEPREVVLCATTHKAAEALSVATKQEVNTIHSHMGLTVRTDFTTGESFISRKFGQEPCENQIIFIDESSYIDEKLLNLITSSAHNCKLIFMGDPAQLTPVNCSVTPVFDRGYPTAELTQVVRQQDGNPVKEWCSAVRDFIMGVTDTLPKLKRDAQYIVWMPRDEFDTAVLKEFTNPEWKTHHSKFLAWRNTTVNRYNKALHKKNSGNSDIAKGDYAINNHYVTVQKGKQSIKTDATVLVTRVEPGECYGVEGKWIDTDKCVGLFQPNDIRDIEATVRRAAAEADAGMMKTVKDSWCDLRAAYACTVNKSQGSTFDKVFIDLDDLTLCRDKNQMARMLYVALSRARNQVILTGG